MPWLTPANANPVGISCRVLYIPDDLEYIQAVTGALLELTYAHNWEQYGAATPDEVTALFQTMLFAYLESECAPMIPVGAIMMHGSATAPAGWLLCDGSAVSRTTYADLFTAIGTTWGVGNETTTFNVPDMRDKSPMGTAFYPIGDAQGNFAHHITTAEQPVHFHTITDPGHGHSVTDPGHVHVLEHSNAVGGGTDFRFAGANSGQVNPNGLTETATTGVSVSSSTTGIIETNSSGGGQPMSLLHPVRSVPFIIYAGV